MNVGNMGSKYLVAYTVVGDAVNLVARLESLESLESLERYYRIPTIVSEATKMKLRVSFIGSWTRYR